MATYNVSNVQELVAAIMDANLNSDADIIHLAPGVYDLSDYDSQVRDAKFIFPSTTDMRGLPLIQSNITLTAASTNPALTIITRTDTTEYGLIGVTAQGTLTLKNLTL